MAVRRPPSRQPPAASPVPPAAGELDGRIRQAEVERMRRQAADRGFQDQVKRAARDRGEDPYEMLARAIRRLLRGE
ncbi:hypothetical protein [Niveispirillum fermenti]|uniref:hypothetical protein n=1 Tax=Niveispirillum fermenti TaxID=1233113 RepID=UPI003A88BAA6